MGSRIDCFVGIGKKAGLPRNFQIIDADDQKRLIRRILKDLEIDESTWVPREIQWFINAQKDEGLRPDHVNDRGDTNRSQLIHFYRLYEQACEQAGPGSTLPSSCCAPMNCG